MTVSIQAKNQSIFDVKSTEIQEGDTVIVYQSRDNLTAIVVTPGQQLNTRYGEFPHSAMIGTQFGSKCPSRKGNGFTYLLRPTPELWTLALPHRTQILYHPDISFVTSQLDIKPGSYVVEAGTGSGSFSHSVARTIGSQGKLFSFEFHEERYSKVAAEFEAHGLLSTVGGPIQLAHQNVIRDGFGDLDVKVDSVFLDLPAPWDALEDAKRIMNRSQLSRICCFSPCIEQVQKTCQTLESLGFSHITMFETLVRTHEPVSYVNVNVEDAVRRIKGVEIKKQARRERQILESQQRRMAAQKPSNPNPETTQENNTKRTLDDLDNVEENEVKKHRKDAPEDPSIKLDETEPRNEHNDKKPTVEELSARESRQDYAGNCKLSEVQPKSIENSIKTEEPESNEMITDQVTTQVTQAKLETSTPSKSGKIKKENSDDKLKGNQTENITQQNIEPAKTQHSILETSKPACMSRGHTSFLTFAVLLPKKSSNLEHLCP